MFWNTYCDHDSMAIENIFEGKKRFESVSRKMEQIWKSYFGVECIRIHKSGFQLWKMSFRRVFVELWVFGVFYFLPQSWELHTADRMRSSYFPANFRVVSPSSQLANPWAGLANLRAGISWKKEQNWDLCKMLKTFLFHLICTLGMFREIIFS
jgi:hypothetical protein